MTSVDGLVGQTQGWYAGSFRLLLLTTTTLIVLQLQLIHYYMYTTTTTDDTTTTVTSVDGLVGQTQRWHARSFRLQCLNITNTTTSQLI